MAESYSPAQLRLLWFLKGQGGSIKRKHGGSLYHQIAEKMDMATHTVQWAAKSLEQRSVVLRTYNRESPRTFGKTQGMVLMKLELVDPKMWLPPMPTVPLAVVIAKENEELEERTAHEPSEIDVIMALVAEVHKRDDTITKLQECVVKLSEHNEQLKKDAARAKRPTRAHLSQPVREIIPDSVWESLRHQGESHEQQ